MFNWRLPIPVPPAWPIRGSPETTYPRVSFTSGPISSTLEIKVFTAFSFETQTVTSLLVQPLEQSQNLAPSTTLVLISPHLSWRLVVWQQQQQCRHGIWSCHPAIHSYAKNSYVQARWPFHHKISKKKLRFTMTYKVLQYIGPVISPVTHRPYCSYYDITGLTTVSEHNKPTLHQHLGFLCQVHSSFMSLHGELYSFFWIFIQKLLSQWGFHYHFK